MGNHHRHIHRRKLEAKVLKNKRRHVKMGNVQENPAEMDTKHTFVAVMKMFHGSNADTASVNIPEYTKTCSAAMWNDFVLTKFQNVYPKQ